MKRMLAAMLLTVMCALTVGPPAAWAYNSFEWWSEAAHNEMLGQALLPLGFTPDAIAAIRSGADGQDAVISKKFTASPDHHCDDNKIPEAWIYIQDRFDSLVKIGAGAPLKPDLQDPAGTARNALYSLGEGLHTLQDFYCHSNYTEWVLLNGAPYAPVDWNNLPAGVKSGQFYWAALYQNEGTAIPQPRADLVNTGSVPQAPAEMTDFLAKIVSDRNFLVQQVGDPARFHTSAEFQDRLIAPEYEKALRYATDDRQVLHYEIAKDSDKTLEGRVITPDGGTLFEKSRQLAILDTAVQWRRIEDGLRNGADAPAAPWTIAALKGRLLPEVTAAALRPKPRVAPGEVFSGEIALAIRNLGGIPYDASRPFTVHARLNLTSTPGFGHATKEVPETEIGLSDGVNTIPLESLGLKAPDEPGTVTLKLEVTLKGDPRTTVRLAEATVEVTGDTTPAGGGPGKWMWVRGKPEIAGYEHPTITEKSATGITYQARGGDGSMYSNTLKWDAPPTVLREGDRVELAMTASAAPWASVGGWYNLRDMTSRNDPEQPGSLNGAGSPTDWRVAESGGSPHAGTLKFIFRPDYEPQVQVSAGHEPNTGTWGLVTWKYQRVPDDGTPSGAPVATTAGTPAQGGGAAPGGPVDVSGKWNTTWGDWWGIELRQEGDRITGSYWGGNGTLEGTIQGRVLRLKWTESKGAIWGGAKFTLSDDGRTMMGSRNDWGDPVDYDRVQYRWEVARP